MPQLDELPLDDLTPARLWAEMDIPTRELAARALFAPGWDDGTARREANRAIAATLHFREVAVRQLPLDKRAGYLVRAVRPDDGLAFQLLMALHLNERRPLLEAFLVELGVPQKDGLIDPDHELKPPEVERLTAAVAKLFASFPAAQVELYLASLLAMDPESWGGLADVVRARRGAA